MAVEVSNAQDVGSAALRVGVEARRAGNVRGIVVVGGIRRNSSGEDAGESDQSELHFEG